MNNIVVVNIQSFEEMRIEREYSWLSSKNYGLIFHNLIDCLKLLFYVWQSRIDFLEYLLHVNFIIKLFDCLIEKCALDNKFHIWVELKFRRRSGEEEG